MIGVEARNAAHSQMASTVVRVCTRYELISERSIHFRTGG